MLEELSATARLALPTSEQTRASTMHSAGVDLQPRSYCAGNIELDLPGELLGKLDLPGEQSGTDIRTAPML